jgi:hypothetical protein
MPEPTNPSTSKEVPFAAREAADSAVMSLLKLRPGASYADITCAAVDAAYPAITSKLSADLEEARKGKRRLEQSIAEVEEERDAIRMDPQAERVLAAKDRKILELEGVIRDVEGERDREAALREDAYRYQQAAEDRLNPEMHEVARLARRLQALTGEEAEERFKERFVASLDHWEDEVRPEDAEFVWELVKQVVQEVSGEQGLAAVSVPRYSTEQARMRLREALQIHEWPQDGTAEEYFIRDVFPDPDQPGEQPRPECERGEEGQWCGECGLHLTPGMPPSVWTGHVHKPVAAEVMHAAWTLLAVVQVAGESDPESLSRARMKLDRLIAEAGLTEEAIRTYGRLSTQPSTTTHRPLEDRHVRALVSFGENSFGPADLLDAHDEALEILRSRLSRAPELQEEDRERVVRSGRTEAGAEYRAHLMGDPDRETVKAVETIVDAAFGEMAEEDRGGGEADGWEQVGSCLEEALGGPQFRHDVRVVYVRMLGKAMARMRSALEPFATFGKNNVNEDGWKEGCAGRDRIVDWFGPSEFRAAVDALSGQHPHSEPVEAERKGALLGHGDFEWKLGEGDALVRVIGDGENGPEVVASYVSTPQRLDDLIHGAKWACEKLGLGEPVEEEGMLEQAEREIVKERDRREDAEERARKAEARPRLEHHHVLALLGAVRDRGDDDDLPEALDRLRAALTQQQQAPSNSGGVE